MELLIRSIPIHYEEFGTGIPLLMLHGWPTDHRHMVADFEPLFQHRTGWRRIYPDVPGMGLTPSASWITCQDQMLEIMYEFLQTLAPKQRFVIAGTSYGGYLARGFVHHYGSMMDGLLLMAPEVITDKAKRQIPSPQILVEDAAFLSALTPDEDEMRSFFVVQSVEALEAFRTVIIPAVSCADHAFLNRLEAQFDFSFSVDQLATPFQSPTLIVTGRQDSSCGYRDAWTLLDNYYRGTFAVLDRAGHGLGVEQKSLFQALVTEWLNRVEEQTTTSLHAPST